MVGLESQSFWGRGWRPASFFFVVGCIVLCFFRTGHEGVLPFVPLTLTRKSLLRDKGEYPLMSLTALVWGRSRMFDSCTGPQGRTFWSRLSHTGRRGYSPLSHSHLLASHRYGTKRSIPCVPDDSHLHLCTRGSEPLLHILRVPGRALALPGTHFFPLRCLGATFRVVGRYNLRHHLAYTRTLCLAEFV